MQENSPSKSITVYMYTQGSGDLVIGTGFRLCSRIEHFVRSLLNRFAYTFFALVEIEKPSSKLIMILDNRLSTIVYLPIVDNWCSTTKRESRCIKPTQVCFSPLISDVNPTRKQSEQENNR